MLRLTKKQHKPYSCLYLWITSMADIPQTVLLSQAVCIGLTQPYSLSGRSRWFLSYIATVPHMNLYVMLDMLKVNFLQIPSMFTTIQYTARSCWYRSPSSDYSAKFLQYRPRKIFTVGESKLTNVIFSYCITTYRAMTNTLSYAIERVQLSCDLKIHSSEEPEKNCTVAKCEVSWADSTIHDVRGYIGWRQECL